MARTKYKLGTFVKTRETEDAATHYGAVEEIHLTQAGTAYKLTGLDDTVTEDDIEQGFRPITQRKATKPAARSTKGKKSREAATTQAAA